MANAPRLVLHRRCPMLAPTNYDTASMNPMIVCFDLLARLGALVGDIETADSERVVEAGSLPADMLDSDMETMS
jgi:hypothetical protein